MRRLPLEHSTTKSLHIQETGVPSGPGFCHPQRTLYHIHDQFDVCQTHCVPMINDLQAQTGHGLADIQKQNEILLLQVLCQETK